MRNFSQWMVSKHWTKGLEQVFQSQQSYDDYMESKRSEFEDFIQQLEEAFQNRMRSDDLNRRVYANIVRPGLDSDRRIPDRKGTELTLGLMRMVHPSCSVIATIVTH